MTFGTEYSAVSENLIKVYCFGSWCTVKWITASLLRMHKLHLAQTLGSSVIGLVSRIGSTTTATYEEAALENKWYTARLTLKLSALRTKFGETNFKGNDIIKCHPSQKWEGKRSLIWFSRERITAHGTAQSDQCNCYGWYNNDDYV